MPVAQNRIVFTDNNRGSTTLIAFQIIIAVYVDRQDPKRPSKSCLQDQLVDILGRNESRYRGQIIHPKHGSGAQSRHIICIAIENKTFRIAVLHQKTAIGLGKIFDPKFDEPMIRDSDLRGQSFDDSILAPLREDPKLGIGKSVEWAGFCDRVGGQPSLLSAP
jgi:hypothetical protein